VNEQRKMQYEPYSAKSMINKLRHVDDWFWASYTLNPYRGCAHGCVYCDARANQYGLAESFEERIFIKENALEVLGRQLPRLQRGVVASGGVCDSYQPIEKERGLTREVVEVLHHHRFPVEVLTKSDLVLRDLDLYEEMARQSWACVFFTITTFDEHIAQRFEPGAATPERRLEALRQVARTGVTTGVAMMPLLPGISDDDRNIEDVVSRVKDAGGQFVLGGGLTLKEGAQRKRYMGFLEAHYSEVLTLYAQLYGKGFEAQGGYGPQLLRRVREVCLKLSIADRMRRPILADDPLAVNKRIAEQLFLRAYDLQLNEAKGYRQWAYRKAAWAVDETEEDIGGIYREQGRKGLEGIKGIGKRLSGEIVSWMEPTEGVSRERFEDENGHRCKGSLTGLSRVTAAPEAEQEADRECSDA
jgi:DNA repair photolyase